MKPELSPSQQVVINETIVNALFDRFDENDSPKHVWSMWPGMAASRPPIQIVEQLLDVPLRILLLPQYVALLKALPGIVKMAPRDLYGDELGAYSEAVPTQPDRNEMTRKLMEKRAGGQTPKNE